MLAFSGVYQVPVVESISVGFGVIRRRRFVSRSVSSFCVSSKGYSKVTVEFMGFFL